MVVFLSGIILDNFFWRFFVQKAGAALGCCHAELRQ
jgi:hypothetical protein